MEEEVIRHEDSAWDAVTAEAVSLSRPYRRRAAQDMGHGDWTRVDQLMMGFFALSSDAWEAGVRRAHELLDTELPKGMTAAV